ncbi:hypothetical protein KEM56_006674 [Ascosphaera pollenicola]|nr:hypothetical protein KEM56_006674 [Ascosphaera pollenicola]
MKVLRFPLPFNVGSDIRILREEEKADFRRRFNVASSNSSDNDIDNRIIGESFKRPGDLELIMTRWLAGRFAAKEAARKAAPLGAGSLSWKDVMVRVEEQSPLSAGAASKMKGSRRPEVLYLQGYRDQDVKNAGDEVARAGKLTISHDGDYIIATVLAPAAAGEEECADTSI